MLLAWVKMPKYRSWWRISRLRFKQLSLLNKLVEKMKSVNYPGEKRKTAKIVVGKSEDMNTEGKKRVFLERERRAEVKPVHSMDLFGGCSCPLFWWPKDNLLRLQVWTTSRRSAATAKKASCVMA